MDKQEIELAIKTNSAMIQLLTEQRDDLRAELIAVRAILRALIQTHPAPEGLSKAFENTGLLAQETTFSEPVEDEMLEYLEDQLRNFREFLASEIDKRGDKI